MELEVTKIELKMKNNCPMEDAAPPCFYKKTPSH